MKVKPRPLTKCFFLSIVFIFLVMLTIGCSTQKNTAQSRWWHSFQAKYNTYYNGTLAYIDGSLEKENGNKDNFTEMIPLYTVGNKQSRELGKGNFERAIEKSEKAIRRHSIKVRPEWNSNKKKTERDIEWLSRREYNPFLWKAWMLLGRSQFMKGDFTEAASTFSYMSRLYHTQPAIYGKARAWLAKCYVEDDMMYDAEDVITKMRRDSMDWRAVKDWNYTYADYYIHQKRYEEAIPYLRKVIKQEMRRKQKAREWYLMGQLESALGHQQLAYKAYKHVVGLNPPYEVEFNARIAMTEVMAGGQSRQMISRLKRMAASDKNKDYLDQVYYAMGNIYLMQKDTMKAIGAYEKGNEKATRSGIEKGVLLLRLGDLYWTKEKFNDAQRCYGEAIGLLDKDRNDYEELSRRSKILDELVPHTDAVHLQDSLQALAKMSEKDRNAAIDRVIEALKKKEKEERNKQAEEVARQKQQEAGAMGNRDGRAQPAATAQTQEKGLWYFYNPIAVSQGKATFQKLWGKRENVDNWQRVNKTVVASPTEMDDITPEMADSIAHAQEVADSLEQVTDSAQNDPHKREYYLAQIPFTEEQVEASNKMIEEGLYNAGVIFKDKLDLLRLSEKHLRRLVDNYPDYERMADAYYHLFLLYSRRNMHSTAQTYLAKLKKDFPDHEWTQLLTDPHYADNARFGVRMEDSLYTATYEAFKADRFTEVLSNAMVSKSRFPQGENRPKFIFVGGLTKLNSGDSKGCLEDMKEVVEKYPQGRISEMAGMIINGVNQGRRLHGGKFDMGDVWSRRTQVMNDSDSIAARVFVADRDIPFVFMTAFEPDSVDENQLLFRLAKYNFTSFMVRNFDITTEELDGFYRMRVSGFRNYDEALQYARLLFVQPSLSDILRKCRNIIISEQNLELLGVQYSYNDYDEFYEQNFAPLTISTQRLLDEPAEIEYQDSEDRENASSEEEKSGGNTNEDVFDFEPAEAQPESETVILDEEVPATKQQPEVKEPQTEEVEVIDEPEKAEPAKEQPKKELPEPVKEQPKKEQPAQKQPTQPIPAKPVQQPVKAEPVQQPPTKTEMEEMIDDDEYVIFDDEPTTPQKQPTTPTVPQKNSQQPAKQQPAKQQPAKQQPAKQIQKQPVKKEEPVIFEDEYYDLEGF